MLVRRSTCFHFLSNRVSRPGFEEFDPLFHHASTKVIRSQDRWGERHDHELDWNGIVLYSRSVLQLLVSALCKISYQRVRRSLNSGPRAFLQQLWAGHSPARNRFTALSGEA